MNKYDDTKKLTVFMRAIDVADGTPHAFDFVGVSYVIDGLGGLNVFRDGKAIAVFPHRGWIRLEIKQ